MGASNLALLRNEERRVKTNRLLISNIPLCDSNCKTHKQGFTAYEHSYVLVFGVPSPPFHIQALPVLTKIVLDRE